MAHLNVLHVAQPTTEGVARYVSDLAAAQVAAGWDVTVATPPSDELQSRLSRIGAAHRRWPAVRAIGHGLWAETCCLRRIVREVDPDVVHLHSSKAGLAGRLAMRGRRTTVFTPHAWSFLHGGAAIRRGALAWERWATRWTSLVICCSNDERARALRMGIRGEVAVVRSGVDLRRFTVGSDSDRSEARHALGLGSEPLAVCVGRLAPQKGQDVLLDAWPVVRRSAANAHLALVGDGPQRARLERRALPGVMFLGNRADVERWYTAADVVVAPSRWEGLSLVVLEALGSGRSIVATDVDGMREAVGGAGSIVPCGNAQALAVAVADRLSAPDLAREEGTRARLQAERFDVTRSVDEIMRLTSEVSTRR